MSDQPPMPSHCANDSAIEPNVGPHTSSRCTAAGMPSISPSTSRSRRPIRLRPRPAGAPGGGASSPARAGTDGTVTVRTSAAEVVRLLLFLDLLHDPVDLVRVVEEVADGALHDVLREVGAGVAVQELRDVLGGADRLGGLLLQLGVAGLVGVVG